MVSSQINEADSFSQAICPTCLSLLQQSIRFRITCILSDRKLRESQPQSAPSPPLPSKNRRNEFMCDICGQCYHDHSTLIIHFRMHTGERPIKCSVCDKSFASISNRNSHVAQQHSTNNATTTSNSHKQKMCDLCGHLFATTKSLHIHCLTRHSSIINTPRRSEQQQRPFHCPYCRQQFADRSNFAAHKRTHSGEQRHKCPQCSRAFNRRSNLVTHLRTHTGERPYECRVCQARFSIGSNLTAHLRSHSNERRWSCEMCAKRFTQKSTLRVHLRTHSGERPYGPCPDCGKRFAHANTFRAHRTTHSTMAAVMVLKNNQSSQ